MDMQIKRVWLPPYLSVVSIVYVGGWFGVNGIFRLSQWRRRVESRGRILNCLKLIECDLQTDRSVITLADIK